jgi:pyruvate formate lyase activating enzyme
MLEFPIEEYIGRKMSIDEVMKEVLSDSITYDESGGGVTFSGGEPFGQYTFLSELLRISNYNNIHTAIDTTGYTSKEILHNVMDNTDLFLYDLKLMDDDEHIKYTGVSNKNILKNLDYLLMNSKDVIIRFPVIPGINDSKKNILLMKKYIESHTGRIKEIHLLPFHNIADNKYNKLNIINTMKNVKSLCEYDLLPLKKEFESIGLKVKISG